MIYLLSIPLENEPWIHAKMIKASSIYVVRCQADDCTAGHVQSAAGNPWVICMPQILFIGSGRRKKQELQQISNMVLSPWDLIATN